MERFHANFASCQSQTWPDELTGKFSAVCVLISLFIAKQCFRPPFNFVKRTSTWPNQRLLRPANWKRLFCWNRQLFFGKCTKVNAEEKWDNKRVYFVVCSRFVPVSRVRGCLYFLTHSISRFLVNWREKLTEADHAETKRDRQSNLLFLPFANLFANQILEAGSQISVEVSFSTRVGACEDWTEYF